MPKPRFDAVIHAPNRLQICALLMPLEEAEFGVVRDRLEVSDSVLSKHLKQLGDAGYLRLRKSTYEGRPRTWAKLTRDGRRAFSAHVEELRRLAALADELPAASES